MSRSDLPNEFEQAVEALLNGTLDADGVRRLEAMLLDRPDLQQQFLDYCQLHTDLGLSVASDRAVEVSFAEIDANKATSTPRLSTAMQYLRKPTPFSMTVATIVIGLLLTAMGFMAAPFYRALTQGDFEHTRPEIQFVAHVSDAYDAEWAEGQLGAFKGAHLVSGRRLALKSGLVEVTFRSGATALFEGPAEFMLASHRRFAVEKGRVTVHVGDTSSTGLAISTPHAEIVDIGTRFGVGVDDAASDVEVFEGLVDVTPVIDGQLARSAQRFGPGASVRVRAGDIVEVPRRDATPRFIQDLQEVGPVIASIRTNSRGAYRIASVPFGEDVPSHTDRDYQWNGVTAKGLPDYLLGAEYVQTAMKDKTSRKLIVELTIRRAGTVYVLASDLTPAPRWLAEQFEPTNDKVGSDTSGENLTLGEGPGVSVELYYDVWKRRVEPGETVRLGQPQDGNSGRVGTYGIVAVPK